MIFRLVLVSLETILAICGQASCTATGNQGVGGSWPNNYTEEGDLSKLKQKMEKGI